MNKSSIFKFFVYFFDAIFIFIVVIGILLAFSISSKGQVNKRASKETKKLYSNLFIIREKGTLFGHQDAMAYGLADSNTRWIREADRSDVKSVSGQHPAIFGWDLGHLELDNKKNLDNVSFDFMKNAIIENYNAGRVNTISWHPNNPLNLKKTTWDIVEKTIPQILNDKNKLKEYKNLLDKLAGFFNSLESSDGKKVPIIFRPYHEHTGSWFWWGANHCSPEEYKEFWIMTYKYLTKTKKVNNLIWAYSTDNFKSEEHYLERFPGDKYVDILGFDTYHRNAPASNESFVFNTKRMVATIRKLGNEKHKLFAVTETGQEKLTEERWWTETLQPILEDSQLSYLLVWRNGRTDHFYAPFVGQKSSGDFLKLVKTNQLLLENALSAKNIYKSNYLKSAK